MQVEDKPNIQDFYEVHTSNMIYYENDCLLRCYAVSSGTRSTSLLHSCRSEILKSHLRQITFYLGSAKLSIQPT